MNKLLLKVVNKTLALGVASILAFGGSAFSADVPRVIIDTDLGSSIDDANFRSVSSDRVIELFKELSAVPRYSGHETKICDWLMAWATEKGFTVTRDTAGCGNVIFDVPATEGRENTSLLVLQVHQDMVRATKDGVVHDWDKDPVLVEATDGWLHSKDHETSLGADDGIGLATVLAIAEGGMAHGPLRVIVTVEEETTQVGVKELDPKWTKDAKALVNVDWEQEGEIAISSACAEMCVFSRALATQSVTGKVLREIAVTGLRGGHSGLDIDKGRDNAIIDLAKTLSAIGAQAEFDLVSFTGGSAENAIPTSATAVIALPADQVEIVGRAAAALESALHEAGETDARVVANDLGVATTAIAAADAAQVLTFVTSLTNGIISMSSAVPGLVQTSSNLGIVEVTASGARVNVCFRSSYEPDWERFFGDAERLASEQGFAFTHSRSCEAWPANPESRLLGLAVEVYKDVYGEEVSVVATHAGLECGTFAAKNPALDMISIGPTVENPHSVNERCEIASIGRVWRLLEGLLLRAPVPTWSVGDGVTAEWDDGVLSIVGTGKVNDFASAAEHPWAGLAVTNMTLAAGVTPGKNTFAGLADTATVNGTVPISLFRAAAGDFVLGNLSPAEASALRIENGEVKMTVEVDASTDLKTWEPAKTVDVTVPVEGEKGFYLLKSK